MTNKHVEQGESTGPKLACLSMVLRYLFHFAKKPKRNFSKFALLNANHLPLVRPAGPSGHHAVVRVVMAFRRGSFEVPGFIYAILSLIIYHVVQNESW